MVGGESGEKHTDQFFDQQTNQSNRLTPEQLAFAHILANPADWGETFLTNRDGAPRKYRSYQREDLECPSPQIVHMDGRAVGKTINVSTLVLWFATVNRGKSILVAAPYQGHLDTVIEEIEHQLYTSDILLSSLSVGTKGKPSIKRKPYFQLEFANGCTVYFRPAGSAGDAFRSLHVDFLIVDEAAWLPESAWKALRQCLNAGGIFRVYSTPNGLRETAYYRMTEGKDWRVFRWPTWITPDWNEKRERDLIAFYGGRDTLGWQHEVAGKHGQPTYGAFNARMVEKSLRHIPDYRKVAVTGEAIAECLDERSVRQRIEQVLNLSDMHGKFWVGGDLGYTSDPTELLLFREDDEEKTLELVLRIHAEHVPYPVISEMIALLERVYHPQGIGIDRGGNGLAVEQELLSLDKFRDLHLGGTLVGYNFGGSIAVGEDDRGKPLKKRVKEEMTQLINDVLNKRILRLPKQDPEVEDQLCTQTYALGDRGVVYSKGYDHVVDAMRCAMLRRAQVTYANYNSEETIVNIKVLRTGPIFV
jgi:hypothetical protein